MLLKAETDIGADETAIELGRRLAVMGADLLVETLAGLQSGAIVPEKQDGSQATYAPLLTKEDGVIDWSQPAIAIHNQVRGFQPWPGARTTFRGKVLNIWKTRVAPEGAGPGVKPWVVRCGEGALELLEVQQEGRKRVSAADFANGQRLTENDRLGEAAT
jgi:methionyl-tRNA formyltransferase